MQRVSSAARTPTSQTDTAAEPSLRTHACKRTGRGRGLILEGMEEHKRKHRSPSKVQASGYCSAHRKYAFSENDAQELLQQVKGHHGKGGKVESRSYKCPWGDHWHLTSKD